MKTSYSGKNVTFCWVRLVLDWSLWYRILIVFTTLICIIKYIPFCSLSFREIIPDTLKGVENFLMMGCHFSLEITFLLVLVYRRYSSSYSSNMEISIQFTTECLLHRDYYGGVGLEGLVGGLACHFVDTTIH